MDPPVARTRHGSRLDTPRVELAVDLLGSASCLAESRIKDHSWHFSAFVQNHS